MIDPIQIKIKYRDTYLFDEFQYINIDEDAYIHIIEYPGGEGSFDESKYKILYLFNVGADDGLINTADEIWVRSLDDKITMDNGGTKGENHILTKEKDIPIIILTKDDDVLPYMMKDRLAYLQDKLNKERGGV